MAPDTYFHRVTALTPTRFWVNNVTRRQAELALDAGAVGCTQNPSYVWKMLTSKDPAEQEYAYAMLDECLPAGDPGEVEAALQKKLVEGIAEKFLPLYEQSHGRLGYVSIQGSPFQEDTESIIRHALSNAERYPNIMAKIPATADGLQAIEYLAAKRVPINATEVMSVAQAMAVCDVYAAATRGMADPAPVYYSHIAGIFDEELQAEVSAEHISIDRGALWQAGISVAKKVYSMTKERCPEVGFISGGARGLHHFTEMVGADACVTINWDGTADRLIDEDAPVVQRFLMPTPHSVIDVLCEKLPVYRKAYFRALLPPEEFETFAPVVRFRKSFETAWRDALALIERRQHEHG